jgi:hypothetical protein
VTGQPVRPVFLCDLIERIQRPLGEEKRIRAGEMQDKRLFEVTDNEEYAGKNFLPLVDTTDWEKWKPKVSSNPDFIPQLQPILGELGQREIIAFGRNWDGEHAVKALKRLRQMIYGWIGGYINNLGNRNGVLELSSIYEASRSAHQKLFEDRAYYETARKEVRKLESKLAAASAILAKRKASEDIWEYEEIKNLGPKVKAIHSFISLLWTANWIGLKRKDIDVKEKVRRPKDYQEELSKAQMLFSSVSLKNTFPLEEITKGEPLKVATQLSNCLTELMNEASF